MEVVSLAEPLGLYIHWPWCVRKCPYCDFNSAASPQALPEDRYIDALVADLEAAAKDAQGRAVGTVYIGGGTPSLMTGVSMKRLLDAVRGTVTLSPDAEISMEANPGTADAEKLEAFAAAGINRLSLGVQSFSDAALLRLGRIHSGDEAKNAVRLARRVFSNINLDLMFALPFQTADDLRRDLQTAISFETEHLSFYELTVEEGTAFGKCAPEGLPDADTAADMGDVVHETLTAAGFEHYEISGYARPGRRCRHNLGYWTFGDYLGIGAGAHGKVTAGGKILRTVKPERPAVYMSEVLQEGWFGMRREVTGDALPFEFMLNVLRLTDGVNEERWTQTTGLPVDALEPALSELRSRRLLVNRAGTIAATDLGRRFLSDVQERFLGENA